MRALPLTFSEELNSSGGKGKRLSLGVGKRRVSEKKALRCRALRGEVLGDEVRRDVFPALLGDCKHP